jgi:hypothetical protein
MLLIIFMFHVQIIELEKRLTQVENELNSMMEEARKKEAAKRSKETTKDMVARWMKYGVGGQYPSYKKKHQVWLDHMPDRIPT